MRLAFSRAENKHRPDMGQPDVMKSFGGGMAEGQKWALAKWLLKYCLPGSNIWLKD